MQKRTIIAFWDLFVCIVISAMVIALSGYIFVIIKGEKGWNDIEWYYTALCALGIAIPFTLTFILQRITIDLNCDKVELFYLVDWRKNSLDLDSNWIIYPSEIQKISAVKLNKEEKRRYTSARFLFSKYLKIEMKFGQVKYVYISHYSSAQIEKIIELLSC